MKFDNLQIENGLVIPPVDESVKIAVRGCAIRGDLVVPHGAWADGRFFVTGTFMSGQIRTYDVGPDDEPEVLSIEEIREKYGQGELSDEEMEREIEQSLKREESARDP